MKKSVSVCIPVFETELYLESCLKSVAEQTFRDFEVIVVNDGSSGVDADGNCCKKIIKICKKKYKLPVNYIEHSENKGLLEARRTAVYAAKGDYIFNLDSDDKLPPNALEVLYKFGAESGADIVHGAGDLFIADNEKNLVDVEEDVLAKIRDSKREKIGRVFYGVIENTDMGKILDGYLVENNHCGFVWGKLFKRELYLEAFDKIPPMFCTMAEDFIQYFWLTYFAKKYVGILDCVYEYCDNTGVSSSRIIDSIQKWKQVCSVASVFTAIYTTLEELEIKLTEEQQTALSLNCCKYLSNNLMQLKQTVVPELQSEAYSVLCEFWGADFVSKVENYLKSSNK